MKKLILVSLAVIASHASFAQEKKQFEVKNFDGIISIAGSSNGLTLEGHNGKHVVIEANVGDGKVPDKAAGLKLVTANGLDNTGIAVTVDEKTINMVTKVDSQGKEIKENVKVLYISLPNATKLFSNYTIKIPHNVNVQFKENLEGSWTTNSAFSVNSLVGDLEVECWRCNLKISEFSGNLIANANGEKVSIEFKKLAQDKISSISSSGDIELILPAETKANLVLNSYRGNVYTDFDLNKISEPSKGNEFSAGVKAPEEIWATSSKDESKKTASTIKGNGELVVQGYPLYNLASTPSFENIRNGRRAVEKPNFSINGGGVGLSVSSFGGNVYLRKK